MKEQPAKPTRLELTVPWVMFSILMSAIIPLLISPLFLIYCLEVYDFFPIFGSKGWFLSHFFSDFGNYFKWTSICVGALCALGQIIIFISPNAASETAQEFNAFMKTIEPSSSSGDVFVRSHYRRKPRK